MKKLIIVTLISAFILSCTSCANRNTAPQPSSSQDISQSENIISEISNSSEISLQSSYQRDDNITSPNFEIDTLEVYRYFTNGEIYSHSSVDFKNKEQNLLSVIDTAVSVLDFIKEPLPIKSIKQEKSFITVDFDESFIHTFSKYELDEIRNTVAMTLLKNQIADSFCFTLNGDKDIMGGNFLPAELRVAEVNAAECKKLTDTVTYEVFNTGIFDAENYKNTFGVEPDQTETEIFHLLQGVNKIENSASSPYELDKFSMYYGLICNTKPYFTAKSYAESEKESYAPQLSTISDSVSAKTGMPEDMLWIADHLKETAKLFYGDDFELDLSSWNKYMGKWIYFPDENVVIPPHMGGGYDTLPFVKSYTEKNDIVNAEIIYLFGSMQGISPWDENENYSLDEIKNYIDTTDQIVNVTMKREKDGRLIFISAQTN